jgi:hypothetical protein
MACTVRQLAGVLVVALVAADGVHAADVTKATTEAESRRKAAENGVKEIKTKSPQLSDDVRKAYAEAALRQNAWLDSACQAVEHGASAVPDVSAAAQSAATSLVECVVIRNQQLGVAADLAGPAAEGVRKSVAQGLTDIASETWRINRTAAPDKRAAAAATLRQRLQWKTWEEIQ